MRRMLLAVTVLCAVAVACNNPVYSRSTVERDLQRDVHLSASQAKCLTDALEQGFTPERLSAHDNPSDVEREEFHRFVRFAIIGCTGTPYDARAVQQGLTRYGALTPAAAACIANTAARVMNARNDAESALYYATALCASSTYDRAAATRALQSLGLSVFSPGADPKHAASCLAAKIEPLVARLDVNTLRTAVTTCLTPPPTTQTTSPKTTTTTA